MISGITSPEPQRLQRQFDRQLPVDTKRCSACRATLPVAQFAPRRKVEGLSSRCRSCISNHYETGVFGCNRCRRKLPGSVFPRGLGGVSVSQPCNECRADARQSRSRGRRTGPRGPYHILSDVNEQAKTAICCVCGPVHAYRIARGWLCGRRTDQLNEAYYDDREAERPSRRWHRIRDVRGSEMRATCSICGDVPVRWKTDRQRFICDLYVRNQGRADAERRRIRRLATYGLTTADYDRMNEAQGRVCAICLGRQDRPYSGPYGALVVDHDHATGLVRALLCNRCNTGLGHFMHDPALLSAAIGYLARHTGRLAGETSPP